MFKLKRPPTTPGEILDEDFMKPYGLTQKALADKLECDIKTINRIVNGRQSISAEMALKFAAAFKTTPDFWLNAQRAVDLYEARKKIIRFPSPVSLAKAKGKRVNG